MDAQEEAVISLKKGTWSPQEDSLLINYIEVHGEGRWNHVARGSGLNRTGKSCRLRWKNYLRPNLRRGNFTLEEQLCIAELHYFYGNRWSKIAEYLPGRTDNEVKNYWRTRVQKHARQLKYSTNSVELKEFVCNIWLPTLPQQVHVSQCNNMNLGEVSVMNYDADGDEVLQMDNWIDDLSQEAIETQFIEAADDLSKNNDCGLLYDLMMSESDFGQHFY